MASQPIVIAVMGPPGSGKTNFIDQLVGTREGSAAHQLQLHTQTVREFTYNSKVRRYVFVDFPAFDDTYRSGRDTLRTIAEWLEKKYRGKTLLSGIIYTHRITDEPMSVAVCKNLDIFCRLCGDRAAGGVRLVTTMWDKAKNRELTECRVCQLEGNFWKPLIEAGARHKRFDENSSRCAWGIVEDLTGGGEPLLLQEELVDEERRLSETTVGQALYAEFQKLLYEQKETIKLKQEEANALKDPKSVKQLEVEQRRLEAELQRTWDDVDKPEIPLFRRIAPYFSDKTRPTAQLEVAESDYVIFVVGSTSAGKTWVMHPPFYYRTHLIDHQFISQLSKNHDKGRHPSIWRVNAWRCNLGNGSDNIIVVDTPFFRSDRNNLNPDRLAEWLESKFNEKCHPGILFLHSLDSDPTGGDMSMSLHLEAFAKAFRNKFTVPTDICIVPTSSPLSAFPKETLSQRLLQLETMTARLNGKGKHDWHASIFPRVFRGQPETAWSAALLLLKGIAHTQTEEFLVSSSPALKRMPSKSPDSHSALKDIADTLFKEFKEQRNSDFDAIIMLGRTALELTPLDHPHRHSALIDFAGLLSERFNKEWRKEYLDELITLKRAVSECMPPDEPQRQTVLLELDGYLSKRLEWMDSVVDLEEIISLRRAALERILPPNRCRALLSLADALHEQFQKGGTEKSMSEALSLAQAALLLCPSGHPDDALPRDHLASYLETTRLALKDLANPLFKESKKEERDRDLDVMITLGQTALEFTPPQHPQRLSVLIGLASLLSERFNRDGRTKDLDELITLKRAVSENVSPDEPQRQTILLELDGYLSERLKRTDSMVDLGEIISLRRAALGHIPRPNQFRALLNLADALHEQFQKQGTENSIVEAIRLTRAALDLCPLGHPDHALARDNLASYVQTKVGKKAARARVSGPAAGPWSTSSYDIERSIKKAVSAKVARIPLRLLHTPTGILCNRDAQISYFEGSLQYQRLVSLASSLDNQQLESEINHVIEEYFGFTTLSHRWGSGEPLIRDVEGKSIDDLGSMDGVEKLQMFCALALQRNFQWAWSDTCCIDKDSSAELQEAIGSMFSWYHWSSLTIVYLSDISEGGSLAGSVWFTRGWTLQELLASHTILFYTNDWSPYLKSGAMDHKSDPALLEELQNVTGISKQHLTNFCPGMDDARSRLHWASGRRTTRPEDIAYSLFGIYQVHLPVFYGESTQNALGRLLAEIISRSGDTSVLDWVGKPSSFNSCFPVDLTPYQTVPHFPLVPSDPARRTSLDLDQAQQLYNSLKRLPRAGFFNSKLTLPSTVHPLTAVKPQGSSTSPPRYKYEIQASRLQPLNVALSVELDESVDTYILIRPWHPKTLDKQADRDVDAVWKPLEQLEQPFNALLLKRLLHNEYTRIACDCTITVRIQDLDCILDSEVLMYRSYSL